MQQCCLFDQGVWGPWFSYCQEQWCHSKTDNGGKTRMESVTSKDDARKGDVSWWWWIIVVASHSGLRSRIGWEERICTEQASIWDSEEVQQLWQPGTEERIPRWCIYIEMIDLLGITLIFFRLPAPMDRSEGIHQLMLDYWHKERASQREVKYM